MTVDGEVYAQIECVTMVNGQRLTGKYVILF